MPSGQLITGRVVFTEQRGGKLVVTIRTAGGTEAELHPVGVTSWVDVRVDQPARKHR